MSQQPKQKSKNLYGHTLWAASMICLPCASEMPEKVPVSTTPKPSFASAVRPTDVAASIAIFVGIFSRVLSHQKRSNPSHIAPNLESLCHQLSRSSKASSISFFFFFFL
jgi:hypothetical protein